MSRVAPPRRRSRGVCRQRTGNLAALVQPPVRCRLWLLEREHVERPGGPGEAESTRNRPRVYPARHRFDVLFAQLALFFLLQRAEDVCELLGREVVAMVGCHGQERRSLFFRRLESRSQFLLHGGISACSVQNRTTASLLIRTAPFACAARRSRDSLTVDRQYNLLSNSRVGTSTLTTGTPR